MLHHVVFYPDPASRIRLRSPGVKRLKGSWFLDHAQVLVKTNSLREGLIVWGGRAVR